MGTASTSTGTSSQSQTLSFRRDSTADGGFDALIVSMAILFGLVFIGAWLFRRRGERGRNGLLDLFSAIRKNRSVEVRESAQLASHTSVHVIHWDGEALLLACNPQAITVLGRRPALVEPRVHSDDIGARPSGEAQNG